MYDVVSRTPFFLLCLNPPHHRKLISHKIFSSRFFPKSLSCFSKVFYVHSSFFSSSNSSFCRSQICLFCQHTYRADQRECEFNIFTRLCLELTVSSVRQCVIVSSVKFPIWSQALAVLRWWISYVRCLKLHDTLSYADCCLLPTCRNIFSRRAGKTLCQLQW